MALTEYGYDEKYVVTGGAGANDGTSFADAWDITQMAANMLAGRRFNLGGDFLLAAAISVPTGGSATVPIGFRGWNAALTAPATSFADMPTVDGNSSYGWLYGNYHQYSGFRFTDGLGFSSTGDYATMFLMEIDNHTGNGFLGDNGDDISFCRIHDNSVAGVDADNGLNVAFCEIYDNTGIGVKLGGFGGTVKNSLIARNGGDGIQSITHGHMVSLNTIDANLGHGIQVAANGLNVSIIANQITNHTTALKYGVSGTATPTMVYNNFYNNTTQNQTAALLVGNTELNPSYVDIANNDYEIQNASLIGQSIPLLGDVNIGAWQHVGGGGSVGGMLVHPGMTGNIGA